MRAGLSDGSVPVDADGGWLHNIAGETHVVAPACFEAFAAGRDLAAATVRNRVVRLHALTAGAGAERFRPGRSPRDEPRGRTPRRPLTRLRRRETGRGGIRQATYAAQLSIRTRRRSNRSVRR